jgi:transcriptional regulator with XRE-family HTH domain
MNDKGNKSSKLFKREGLHYVVNGTEFKRARLKKKLTWRQCAEALDWDVARVIDIEKNERKHFVTEVTALKIKETLSYED